MRASIIACLTAIMITAAPAFSIPALAEEKVKAGEKIWLNFTCRAEGQTVMTTMADVAADPADPKSAIFVPLKKYEPLQTQADLNPTKHVSMQLAQAMEHEIEYQLAAAAVGAKVGQKRKVAVGAIVSPSLSEGERYFKFARVRTRPKEERFAYIDYLDQLGDPKVGQYWPQELGVPARVVAVSNDDVTVRYEIKEGASIETEAGPGVLKDAGNNYEIHLQRKAGDVMRIGPLVGRVAEVNDTFIIIDFGHPFGGHTLGCDMVVVRRETNHN